MNRAGSVARIRLSTDGTRLETRPWFKSLARTGFGARGAIYVLLCYLAFDIAVQGSSPTQESSEGALQEVARQPAAPVLLSALAAGLAAYGCFRLVQVLAGRSRPEEKPSILKRIAWFAIAVVYLSLCARSIELILGRSTGNSAANNPRPWASTVLSWPAGPELLGLAGACLLIGGATLAIWGFVHDFNKDLALEDIGPAAGLAVRVLGALGDLARGFLVGLVGGYLIHAAESSNPSQAKSVDSALRSLVHTSYGPVLISLAAAGLGCYALYSFAEAACAGCKSDQP